jgi:hypothetical protein
MLCEHKEAQAMKRVAMLVTVLLALAGETPAPPVRHLEYAFAIYPVAKPNNGYYNGTLSVDVLGPAPDGGMLVSASEWWYYTLRPRQTRGCEVYPTGSVRCDDTPPYPSESELVLFPLLADKFISNASATGASSWEQKFTLSFSKGLFVTDASMDLSAMPRGDGRLLDVKSTGVFQQVDRHQWKEQEDGKFLYDRVASIPVLVHEERAPTPTRSVYSSTAVDLRLIRDSGSDASPSGAIRYQINTAPVNPAPGSPSNLSQPTSPPPGT